MNNIYSGIEKYIYLLQCQSSLLRIVIQSAGTKPGEGVPFKKITFQRDGSTVERWIDKYGHPALPPGEQPGQLPESTKKQVGDILLDLKEKGQKIFRFLSEQFSTGAKIFASVFKSATKQSAEIFNKINKDLGDAITKTTNIFTDLLNQMAPNEAFKNLLTEAGKLLLDAGKAIVISEVLVRGGFLLAEIAMPITLLYATSIAMIIQPAIRYTPVMMEQITPFLLKDPAVFAARPFSILDTQTWASTTKESMKYGGKLYKIRDYTNAFINKKDDIVRYTQRVMKAYDSTFHIISAVLALQLFPVLTGARLIKDKSKARTNIVDTKSKYIDDIDNESMVFVLGIPPYLFPYIDQLSPGLLQDFKNLLSNAKSKDFMNPNFLDKIRNEVLTELTTLQKASK